MKRVFFDANIVVDVLAERKPWFQQAMVIMTLAQKKCLDLFCSLMSLGTAFYLLDKEKVPNEIVKKKLKIFVSVCKPIIHCDNVLSLTINSSFTDLEDAMQYFSALNENCDVIITRNKKDFTEATIPVMTPQEFLDSLPDDHQ